MPNDINDALGEMALSAATVFAEENPDANEYSEIRTVNDDIFAMTITRRTLTGDLIEEIIEAMVGG